MKVMDVIQLLEKEGTWIRSDFKTRDHLLHGREDAQIHTVGVCWVATMQAIQEAARHKADMIITHENPFYQCSTQMHTAAYEAAKASAGCWISTGSVYTAVMMYGTVSVPTVLRISGRPCLASRLNSVHRLPIIRLRIFLKCVWRIWQGIPAVYCMVIMRMVYMYSGIRICI